MRRISVFVTLAFLAGLAIGLFVAKGRTIAQEHKDTRGADLAAIGKLHKADVAATLPQDPAAMTALFSDDAVNLQFPGGPVVGTKAMKEAYVKFRADYPDFQVLKYVPNIKEVQIVDGWALEVISGTSTFRTSAKDAPVTVEGKSMRVLERQPDGSWKFALVGLK
jgi:uncharacterized protein (TIGR02246 family)